MNARIEEAAKRIRQISLCKVLICFLRRRDKAPSKPADTVKSTVNIPIHRQTKKIIQTAVNKSPQPLIVYVDKDTVADSHGYKDKTMWEFSMSSFSFISGSDVKRWYGFILRFPCWNIKSKMAKFLLYIPNEQLRNKFAQVYCRNENLTALHTLAFRTISCIFFIEK